MSTSGLFRLVADLRSLEFWLQLYFSFIFSTSIGEAVKKENKIIVIITSL